MTRWAARITPRSRISAPPEHAELTFHSSMPGYWPTPLWSFRSWQMSRVLPRCSSRTSPTFYVPAGTSKQTVENIASEGA
jgi:hypothetical protein